MAGMTAPLRQYSDAAVTAGPPRRLAMGAALFRDGRVAADALVNLLSHQGRDAGRLADVLRARGLVDDQDLLQTEARNWGVGIVDLAAEPPDPRLIGAMGGRDCLRYGLVPWRRVGGVTVVAMARPGELSRLRTLLEQRLGPVCAVLAPAPAVEAAIHAQCGPALAHAAETRVPNDESCRSWGALHRSPVAMGLVAGLTGLALAAPQFLSLLLLTLAAVSLALLVALKLAALVAALWPPGPTPTPAEGGIPPIISIIVALYRESDIAPRLVARLARLDYPADLLDVILVVEADDQITRDALARSELPLWMRVITVPNGSVKTKPRALNHALDYARGAIIGIYDAEDAPDSDQLQKVVAQFQRSGPEVACLQGVLDYYNPHTNWLSRCFTIEYAGWFRLILPGIARLGLVVPLGGTTLFFRRSVLEELGAWDAHNVTEDADLGLRLARHGYRTDLVATTTYEEANCRAVPWIKQRSRWIKGYMMTWAVHMRHPGLLWRQLGPWRFFGVQVLFLGTIAQFLLAPVLWSLALVPFGVPHPMLHILPAGLIWAGVALFTLSEFANLAIGIIGLKRSGQRLSLLWVPTLKVYYPLASVSGYKALIELATRPFYWDKTTHGIFDHLGQKPR
jgi:cellulose synthase/poly-beta-1,6-N-acetylglucosamine synthase-like glycosyltransferase